MEARSPGAHARMVEQGFGPNSRLNENERPPARGAVALARTRHQAEEEMARPYLISKPNPATLVLKESRRWQTLFLCAAAAFYIYWCKFLLSFYHGFDGIVDRVMQLDWFAIVLVAVPASGLAHVARLIASVARPRIITFDSDTHRIVEGGKLMASFEDVSKIQINTIKASDEPDDYELRILTKSAGRIRIWYGSDYEAIAELANEMAEKMGTNIERTT
jgi:hypothetical protein